MNNNIITQQRRLISTIDNNTTVVYRQRGNGADIMSLSLSFCSCPLVLYAVVVVVQ